MVPAAAGTGTSTYCYTVFLISASSSGRDIGLPVAAGAPALAGALVGAAGEAGVAGAARRCRLGCRSRLRERGCGFGGVRGTEDRGNEFAEDAHDVVLWCALRGCPNCKGGMNGHRWMTSMGNTTTAVTPACSGGRTRSTR